MVGPGRPGRSGGLQGNTGRSGGPQGRPGGKDGRTGKPGRREPDPAFVSEIMDSYVEVKGTIEERMEQFGTVWREDGEEELFRELAFCIFTPQSRARSCWEAVERLTDMDMLFDGPAECIAEEINTVRFRNNKARNLVAAREMFTDGEGNIAVRPLLLRQVSGKGREAGVDGFELRDWLVKEVKGYGYKEASHFLRNVGLGENLAILDRHILKNLARAGAIDEVPEYMNRKTYLELEERMRAFAADIGIPMAHLDLVLWYMEAGEVFK